MSGPPVRARMVCQQIIDHELHGRESAAEVAAGLESAFARLETRMAELLGRAGFGAVFKRAVHLTRPSFPFLDQAGIRFEETLTMNGIALIVEQEGAAPMRAAAVLLLQNVVELLNGFIGEGLTLRMLARTWPELIVMGSGPERPDS